LRSGYFFFSTAANPGIDKGGLFGESKIDILNHFSDDYKPKTYHHKSEDSVFNTIELLKNRHFELPIIVKPNIGERGAMVQKVETFLEIEIILKSNKIDFIIQEYIDYKFEFGVLYSRLPGNDKGKVSSVVQKGFLTVVGDGIHSCEQLLLKNKRAWFQIERLQLEKQEIMKTILPKNESLIIEPIGNHCRGTEFINANQLITEKLNEVFDKISKQFDGFYYGRFDMKAKSIEEFQQGKTIKIFELNGVTSEPGHIYDKNYTLLNAYYDLYKEYYFVYKISRVNITNGIMPLKFGYMFKLILNHFKNK